MTLRSNLLRFFEKNDGKKQLLSADLLNEFNEITDFKFMTPTQFQHFKNALLSGNFLTPVERNKKILSYNWDAIRKYFPEMGGSVKKE